MSFDAMAWAAKQKTNNSLTKLVLIMLANYTDQDHKTFPSYKHLASLCECTERSVMNCVKSLQEQGMLVIEHRFGADGKQTSNLFTLNVRGEPNDRVGVNQTAPNTINNTHTNNSRRGEAYTEEFSLWWKTYPRRDGSKAKAFEVWKRVTGRKISAEALLEKTKLFARSQHGKDSQFIPHATTWLNQERWETVQQTVQLVTTRNSLAG